MGGVQKQNSVAEESEAGGGAEVAARARARSY